MIPSLNFSFYGTAQGYAKAKQLTAKWNLKKSGQDVQTKSTSISSATFSRKQATADKVTQIMTKLKSGKRPSAEDLQFLKDNSPAYYQKVVKILQERDQYKADLDKCKTKDDVKRLEIQKAQQIAIETGEIMNNPNIPDGKKFEFAEEVLIRNAGLSAEKARFTSSGKYARLEWEQEIAAEEEEAKQVEPEQVEPEQTESERTESEQVESERTESEQAQPVPSDTTPSNLVAPSIDQNNLSEKRTQNGTKKVDNDLPFESAKRRKKQYKAKFRPTVSNPPFPQKPGTNSEISASPATSPSPVSAPPLQTAQTAKKAIYASTVANTATPAKAIVKFSAVI